MDDPLFAEPFSLRQIYVPLRGFYQDDERNYARGQQPHESRVIVDLESELIAWLEASVPDDAVRMISGGPGSGKSSFSRVFAATLATKTKRKVLSIALHQFDPSLDLEAGVGSYVMNSGILPYNPLNSESGGERLLIIFDGLDELALQGKAAAEVALSFVREVQRQVSLRNHESTRLQVLITGRELVVQANMAELRKPGSTLHVLPYYVDCTAPEWLERENRSIIDSNDLLAQDQRQEWWRLYGKVKGVDYSGMPEELGRDDLSDITSQPLLNYLVALSYARGEVDFSGEFNINDLYLDLITAVHERAYAGQTHISVRGMEFGDFVRVMEEVGLASWHGDGRTTTVEDIAKRCESSGLSRLLEVFEEGAKAGATRLLTAFYFRQHEARRRGERTFEFTHKSFGEYLIARRIAGTLDVMIEELERRSKSVDRGWSERDALRHWCEVCGPSPLDEYIADLLRNQLALNADLARARQDALCKLLGYVMAAGMPIEMLEPRPRYSDEQRQARNAEEALLVTLNAVARVSESISKIPWPEATSAGDMICRLQRQRNGPANGLALSSLSWLNFNRCVLDLRDFWRAELRRSSFCSAVIHYANFSYADLREAAFEGAILEGVDFVRSDLQGARFRAASLKGCDFESADLEGAVFDDAVLRPHHGRPTRVATRRARTATARKFWESWGVEMEDISREEEEEEALDHFRDRWRLHGTARKLFNN